MTLYYRFVIVLVFCYVVSGARPTSDHGDESLPMPGVRELTSANFDTIVSKTYPKKYWFIQFYGPAMICPTCHHIAWLMKALGEKVGDHHDVLAIGKYEGATDATIPKRFGLAGYPFFILMKPDGTWVEYFQRYELALIYEFL
eukprot:PhF_6_TR34061/c0_g1_i1/m.49799